MKTLFVASLLAASALLLTGTADAAGNGRSGGSSGNKSYNSHRGSYGYGYGYGYGVYGYPQYTYAPFCGPVLESPPPVVTAPPVAVAPVVSAPPVYVAPVYVPAPTYYTPYYGYGYNSWYRNSHRSHQTMHSRSGGRR